MSTFSLAAIYRVQSKYFIVRMISQFTRFLYHNQYYFLNVIKSFTWRRDIPSCSSRRRAALHYQRGLLCLRRCLPGHWTLSFRPFLTTGMVLSADHTIPVPLPPATGHPWRHSRSPVARSRNHGSLPVSYRWTRSESHQTSADTSAGGRRRTGTAHIVARWTRTMTSTASKTPGGSSSSSRTSRLRPSVRQWLRGHCTKKRLTLCYTQNTTLLQCIIMRIVLFGKS